MSIRTIAIYAMSDFNDGIPELEEHRISSLPYGLYYLPHFLSPEEERSLLDKVNTSFVPFVPDKS